MAKFLKLTELRNWGEPRKLQPVGDIYVNLDQVESMKGYKDGSTSLRMASGHGNIILVKETPAEIIRLAGK